MYAPAHTRSKQERGTERRRKALKVPERARKKRASAHPQEPASGVNETTPNGVRWALAPYAPPSAETASVARVGAVAAIEQDDRALHVGTSAPPFRPRVSKQCRPVQAVAAIAHTARTGTGSPPEHIGTKANEPHHCGSSCTSAHNVVRARAVTPPLLKVLA